MKRLAFILLLCTFSGSMVLAQVQLQGEIKDILDSTSVPFATLVLYPYQSSKILAYTQSDEDGKYLLQIPSTEVRVFTLQVNHVSYHTLSKQVILSDSSVSKLALPLFVNPKTITLQDIIVQSPVIVKKDTVIYDIEHFRKANDQTLEDVLVNLPGFKLLANGDIQVNGKTVQKVLINGEEVTDQGATLITRSLGAGNVKSVEIRFDEKNDKLKESLLDTREYVVLDIQLDQELNQAWFGKVRATLGYQDALQPGGYVNIFSLKKKFKTHFFTEQDNFGEQTISITDIKNLGEEAINKMFEIPADFTQLSERPAFQDEIFGFRNYTLSQKSVLGVSAKWTLSPSLDMYFGSYNALDKNQKVREYEQNFEIVEFSNQLTELEALSDYSSKNKLELKYDKGKVKAKLNLNAILFRNELEQQNSESLRLIDYRYQNIQKVSNFYENLLIEWKASPKWGFQFKAAHNYLSTNHDRLLIHNDTSYTLLGADPIREDALFTFRQPMRTRAHNFISEATTQYQSFLGDIRLGLRYQYRYLRTLREGFAAIQGEEESTQIMLENFTNDNIALNTNQWTGFLTHRIALGDISFDNQAQVFQVHYPATIEQQSQSYHLGYRLSAAYAPNSSQYSISFSQNLSSFPLEKLVPAFELLSFQSIRLPARDLLSPLPEYNLSINIYQNVASVNSTFSALLIYGQVQNSDRFLFPENNLLFIDQSQLRSEYLALSFPIETKLRKAALKFILEPEYLTNRIENALPTSENYFTQTDRYLLGLKMNTEFDKKTFNFFIYPKYSAFIFRNELITQDNRQNMLSLDMTLRISLLEEKLFILPKGRTVRFTGFGEVNTFSNLSLRIEAPTKKWFWFISFENILNDRGFVRQSIFPTYFIAERNSVFSRYLQMGIEYRFK